MSSVASNSDQRITASLTQPAALRLEHRPNSTALILGHSDASLLAEVDFPPTIEYARRCSVTITAWSIAMPNQTRNLVIVALVAALVAVTCWKQSSGQGEPAKPAAVIWEYRIVDSSRKTAEDEELLNKLGAEGWDVCVAYRGYTDHLILRRPKTVK
jgi:hypothetical protein